MERIDIWVDENSRLYIAHPYRHALVDLAARANQHIREWDYADKDILTPDVLFILADAVWVDEQTLWEESWPADKVFTTPQPNLIEVWTYDLETIITRSYA